MSLIDTETRAFTKGDRVVIAPDFARAKDKGVVYVIEKEPVGARGVNYVAQPLAGGQGVKAPGYMFVPATEDQIARAEALAPEGKTPEIGSVVSVKHPGMDGFFVVLGVATRKAGCFKIARLGGDGGRYYSSIPGSLMTVIDPATITVQS